MDPDRDIKKSYTGLIIIVILLALIMVWILSGVFTITGIALSFLIKYWIKIGLGIIGLLILRRVLFRKKGIKK